jgi:hypothetical protein
VAHPVFSTQFAWKFATVVATNWKPLWAAWTTFELHKALDAQDRVDHFRNRYGTLSPRVGWLNYLRTVDESTEATSSLDSLRRQYEVQELDEGCLVKLTDEPLLERESGSKETLLAFYDAVWSARAGFDIFPEEMPIS